MSLVFHVTTPDVYLLHSQIRDRHLELQTALLNGITEREYGAIEEFNRNLTAMVEAYPRLIWPEPFDLEEVARLRRDLLVRVRLSPTRA